MKECKKYEVFRFATGMLLMFLLLWLTISAPLVNARQQQLDVSELAAQESGNGEEENFAGNCSPATEERTETSPTLSEEYIHESRQHIYETNLYLQHAMAADADGYRIPVSELLSPPPEA
jgi:hypothetical protein